MKPTKPILLTTVLSLLLLWITFTFAAPNAINFQGRLTDADGNTVPDSTYTMVFLVYDGETGGSRLWSESQDVNVTNGIYNVTLGQGTSLGGVFDAELFAGDDRWLEVWFDGEEFLPRQKITSVAYALQAGSTTAGAVTSIMLADGAVTEGKVADGAITASKIVGGPDSGLDSDRLDGHDSTYFAASTHNHDTRYYTRDDVDLLIQSYESRIAALEAKLAKLTVSQNGNQIYITGANLHVRNDSGTTDGAVDGLGNVIIGYDETRSFYSCSLGRDYQDQTSCETAGGLWWASNKTGSHNLIVGTKNNYSSYGGIVIGESNAIYDEYSSVSGGRYNSALGHYSSVSGGLGNTASGQYASVSGGYSNTASGSSSSVSGGYSNKASDYYSTVSGGSWNEANGSSSSVSGGQNNKASGFCSSVVGGGSDNPDYGNHAYANYSSILGGIFNIAGSNDTGLDPLHTVGERSTISGGDTNRTGGTSSTVSGGVDNHAIGTRSTVSGGAHLEETANEGYKSPNS